MDNYREDIKPCPVSMRVAERLRVHAIHADASAGEIHNPTDECAVRHRSRARIYRDIANVISDAAMEIANEERERRDAIARKKRAGRVMRREEQQHVKA